jgi:hypothetical protein
MVFSPCPARWHPCRTSSLPVVRERKPARGAGGSYISTLAAEQISQSVGSRARRASARGKRPGGAYRDDDVVDCFAGYGSVGFVVEERSVGGVGVSVESVGRQCGHAVLLRLPLIVGSLVCGEDDQRLTVEAGQGRRLLHRRVRRSILLDGAGKAAGRRGLGAGLVPGARRKSGVGERVEQTSGSEVTGRGRQGGGLTRARRTWRCAPSQPQSPQRFGWRSRNGRQQTGGPTCAP